MLMVGDTATISGTLYTVVDNSTIQPNNANGNITCVLQKLHNMSVFFIKIIHSILILIFGIYLMLYNMSEMFLVHFLNLKTYTIKTFKIY